MTHMDRPKLAEPKSSVDYHAPVEESPCLDPSLRLEGFQVRTREQGWHSPQVGGNDGTGS